MQAQARSLSVQRDETNMKLRLMWLGFATMLFVMAQTLMAHARGESLAPLAEQISPAVVNITTSTLIEGQTGPQGIVPEGSPFEDFFREFLDRNDDDGTPSPRRSNALSRKKVSSASTMPVSFLDVVLMPARKRCRQRKAVLTAMPHRFAETATVSPLARHAPNVSQRSFR